MIFKGIYRMEGYRIRGNDQFSKKTLYNSRVLIILPSLESKLPNPPSTRYHQTLSLFIRRLRKSRLHSLIFHALSFSLTDRENEV